MAETVLDVKNLQVKFRVSKTETITAIQDVTFSVKKAKRWGL